MSLFVEVFDLKKKCPVIINLDMVTEVTPFLSGGCEISFSDAASVNGRRVILVKEDFPVFQQLCMHMVTSEKMAERIEKIKSDAGVVQEQKAIAVKKTGKTAEYDIPKL